ncbi:MAG TPA: winged helix-turn-helix transcriptional regulator [Anaerolineales bacterium]|nr:winged helix-turn-helix transcriptional regulator [Anaerolineales bacterium]
MTTARQKILTYLAKNRAASAREISRGTKMSAATVRHHLRMMSADGRLEVESEQRLEGRGRPQKIYTIPRAMLGDNLSMLGDALLTEAGSRLKMEALAKRLAGESDLADQPIARRLNQAIEKLNQMNYHARWEAGPEGPRILFGHCPYAAIVEKHPELCEMDASLISQMTSRSVLKETRPETQKSSICPHVFLIR